VCYEEKRNEVSDELAFSFLNKVKRNFFDCFFRIKKNGLPKSSKKKKRFFLFFHNTNQHTKKKSSSRDVIIRPFAEEENKLDFVCCLRLFFSAAPRL
jgi:hypothetical protein